MPVRQTYKDYTQSISHVSIVDWLRHHVSNSVYVCGLRSCPSMFDGLNFLAFPVATKAVRIAEILVAVIYACACCS